MEEVRTCEVNMYQIDFGLSQHTTLHSQQRNFIWFINLVYDLVEVGVGGCVHTNSSTEEREIFATLKTMGMKADKLPH